MQQLDEAPPDDRIVAMPVVGALIGLSQRRKSSRLRP
jgi:hypothetical protein